MGNNTNTYNQTAIGLIPYDWEVKKLGGIVDEKRPITYGIVQTGEPVVNGVKCLRVVDIIDGKINLSNLITTSVEISNGYRRTMLVEGDLVIALRGKIGELALITKALAGINLTRGVGLIALKNNYYNDFIRQQLISDSGRKLLESKLNGSALQELSINVLRNIFVSIPPLPEQQKIATILTTWDVAIDNCKAIIEKIKERNKGLAQQLLNSRRWEVNNERWMTYSFEENFEILRSHSISREGLSTENNSNKTYCIHYGDIHTKYKSGFIDFLKMNIIPQIIDDLFCVNPDDYLKEGDLIIADASEDYEGVGECVEIMNIENKKAVSGLHTIAIRASKGLVVNGFLSYLFSYSELKNQLRKKATGTSVYSVSKTTIKTLLISLPSLDVQTKIRNILNTAAAELNQYQQKLQTLQLQKKGLMQQLLTGKVRVKINN